LDPGLRRDDISGLGSPWRRARRLASPRC